MGEIKSTLDLIMEKTRHLTMNEEEKKGYKEKELTAKVKGLVQRRLDGMAEERFLEEIRSLFRGFGDEQAAGLIFRGEVAGRFEIGKDNEPLLNMLKTALGTDPGPVRRILRQYESRAVRITASREESLREKLKEKGISGPAAVPNLEADQTWRQMLDDLRMDLKEELRRVTG